MRLSVHEAKAKFSAVLRAAEQGETIVVTRHDKPVAEIRPVSERRVPVLGAFADGSKPVTLEDVSWTDEELVELFGEDIIL